MTIDRGARRGIFLRSASGIALDGAPVTPGSLWLIPQSPSGNIASAFCVLVQGLWTKVRMPVLPIRLQGSLEKPSCRVGHVWPVFCS